MLNNFKDDFVKKVNESAIKYKLKKSDFDHYYVDPMPTNEELSEFYKDKYFNNEAKTDSKGMDIGSLDVKERFHYDRQYNEIISFLKNNFKNKDISILDVGCGTGKFLEYLYDNGYTDLQGTEYDSSLNNVKIDLFNGGFLDFKTDKKFDFISFNNVLEHVINPFDFLQKAHSLLKDNGCVRVQVPNDFSYTQFKALDGKENPNFFFFSPPEHLHYFDFNSMNKMLIGNSFEVIKKMTNWSMDIFLLMGMDYSKDPSLGKLCHNYRVEFEYKIGEDLLLEFYEKMAELEIGRVVIEYARKN